MGSISCFGFSNKMLVWSERNVIKMYEKKKNYISLIAQDCITEFHLIPDNAGISRGVMDEIIYIFFCQLFCIN